MRTFPVCADGSYPEMRAHESRVYVGNDFNPENPLGCAHWAPLTQSIHHEITNAFGGIENDLGTDLLARALLAGTKSEASVL